MIKRKKEHIELALNSQITNAFRDERFNYEPLFNAHPNDSFKPFDFLGKKMKVPIWISSMTGGSEFSGVINSNLAKACAEFGMGMGLGSCRALLEEGKYFDHFNLRPIIGNDYPFYANLGIKQLENAVLKNDFEPIVNLIEKLYADGIIIHINPIQEWLQPEGDNVTLPPIQTIESFVSKTKIKTIIKEVGQGFGSKSIHKLLTLPIEAIELAAFGGTNFAKVELKRSNQLKQELLGPLSTIGNDANQMIDDINEFVTTNKHDIKCKSIIISGGISSFLDGYYFMQKCELKSIYGQASKFLQYAREDYDKLQEYILYQIEGLKLATAYLEIKEF